MIRLTTPQSPGSSYTTGSIQSSRLALLKKYHVTLPEKGEHGWESVRRFIEGKPLSGEDCAYFSRLAAGLGSQDIGFLSSLQAMEKSFIHTLYLDEDRVEKSDEESDEADPASTQRTIAAADMLEQTLETGLSFRTSVDHKHPAGCGKKTAERDESSARHLPRLPDQ